LGQWPRRTRYAPIDQINLENVRQLKLAWRFDNPVKAGKAAQSGSRAAGG
jgi:glucose dehydrogenase